jgi:hypothetical protein
MDCIRCRYSLVGLPQGGVCPECGLPIAGSLGFRPRPGLCRAPAGRVYLGVFVGAVGEFCLALAVPWEVVGLRKVPAACILGAMYACLLICLWGWSWSLCIRWEDVPRGVPTIACIASLLLLPLIALTISG